MLALALMTEAAGSSFIILLPLYLASPEVGGARFGLTVAFINGFAVPFLAAGFAVAPFPLVYREGDETLDREAAAVAP